MKPLLLILACATLASCSMYNSHFDCPAGKGIGCQSVNEVLNLIVEKEEGEDVFVTDRDTALLLKIEEKKKKGRKPAQISEEKTKFYLLKERSGDPVLIEAKGQAAQ